MRSIVTLGSACGTAGGQHGEARGAAGGPAARRAHRAAGQGPRGRPRRRHPPACVPWCGTESQEQRAVCLSGNCVFHLAVAQFHKSFDLRSCRGDTSSSIFIAYLPGWLRADATAEMMRADAPQAFLEQQVAAFLHSIDTGAEAPVLAEDLKFQARRSMLQSGHYHMKLRHEG